MLRIQKRIHVFLSLLIMLSLLAGLLPALTIPAAAAGDFSCDLSYGSISIDASTNTLSYSDPYTSHQSTFIAGTSFTIIQTNYATASTSNCISVTGSGTVNLTLNGVNLSASSGSPFSIASGAEVNLTLTKINTLTCSKSSCAGLSVPSDATLTITSASTGSLSVTGGDGGAGIGGGYSVTAGTINICGGTVTTNAGHEGAGIGGGSHGSGGAVKLSGGIVKATGSNYGAGIGGGSYCSGGTVTISGGTVTAASLSSSAGIGGGFQGSGVTVYISGGSVKASSVGGEAIGKGEGGSGSVTLQNNSTDKTAVYLTTVELANASGTNIGESTVSTLTASLNGVGYSYGTKDMKTDSNGMLYLYLPANTATTAAVCSDDQYTGSVTTNSSGSAVGTLTKTATINAAAAACAYDGSSHAGYTANVLNASGNTVSTSLYTLTPTYYSGTDTTATPLSGSPTDVGEYTVVLSLSSTNYKASSVSVSFNISQQSATISATAVNCAYDGSSHAGYTVTAVKDTAGATIDSSLYALTPIYYSGSSASGTALSSVPTDTGTYTVSLKLISTNYTATSVSVTFKITQQAATISATTVNCTYDGSSHDGYTIISVKDASNNTIPAGKYTITPTYYSGSTASGTALGSTPADAGTYTALLNLSSTNYTTTAQSVTFTIDKYQPAVTLLASSSPTTVGVEVSLSATVSKASNGAYPSGDVIFEANESQLGTGSLTDGQAQYLWTTTSAETFKLTAKYEGDTNYAAASDTISSYDVSKYNQADLSISGVPTTLTYGDSAFTLTASGGSGTGAVSWSSSDKSVASVDSTGEVTINGAGSCDITATKAADNAYNEASAQTGITVSKQSATISAMAVPGTYNGSSQAGYQGVSVNSVNSIELSINLYTLSATYYSGSSTSGTALSGAPTDAGTYIAVLNLTSANYIASTVSVTFTIDKYQPTISTLPTASSIRSGSKLSASTLTGGVATGVNGEVLSGSFAWTDGTIAVSAAGSYSVTFTPDNTYSTNYAAASADAVVSLKSSEGSSSGASSSSGGSSSTTSYDIMTSTSGGLTTTTTTATATLGSDGTAAASVTGKQLTEAIEKAKAAATENKTQSRIGISVSAPGSASGISLAIPKSAFDTLADSTIGSLRVTTSSGAVTFDSTAIDAINNKASGDITITIKEADTSGLSDEDKTTIGGRPVYDFTVSSGRTSISDFGGGTATISIPYTLADSEDPNNIVIYYISDSGELVMVSNCIYNASTGTITFKTTHFSTYAVGYNDVSFTDVASDAWYADYVSCLAARGIISGTVDGAFSPDVNITRAQFATILANLSGTDLSGFTSSAFNDVSTNDWYFPAVQWAYENGAASGTDGRFDPNAYITRQDIVVMIERYAQKVAGYTLPETTDAVTFTDASDIAAYASEAVTAMQQAGIISGNNGSFAPTENATRAQTAKMIALLLQGMIE